MRPAVVVDGIGDVLVAGIVTNGAGDEDGWLRKYTPDGDERWTAVIDGDEHGDDRVWGLALDDSDCAYIAGEQTVAAGTRAWMAMVTP